MRRLEHALAALRDAVSSNNEARFHDITAQAINSGNATLLKEALNHGSDHEEFLVKALDNGSPEILACLLDAGLDINYRMPGYSGNPLTCASFFAKIPLIKFLLSRGADPNMANCGWGQYQLKPLAAPAEGWKRDADVAKVMEVLLNGGARWEESGALQMAAREGKLECVKVLLNWGVDVNEVVKKINEKSAVKLAELKGREDIVSILRANGAKE